MLSPHWYSFEFVSCGEHLMQYTEHRLSIKATRLSNFSHFVQEVTLHFTSTSFHVSSNTFNRTACYELSAVSPLLNTTKNVGSETILICVREAPTSILERDTYICSLFHGHLQSFHANFGTVT
jgi:hypothetical protein